MQWKKSRKKSVYQKVSLRQYSLGFSARWAEARDKNISSFSSKIRIGKSQVVTQRSG